MGSPLTGFYGILYKTHLDKVRKQRHSRKFGTKIEAINVFRTEIINKVLIIFITNFKYVIRKNSNTVKPV